MVIEKERNTVNEGISEYTVTTRKTVHIKLEKLNSPSNTYNIGDRVYFAVED